MLAQVVLIIDSKKEKAQKYKKIIQQDCYIYPVISHDISDAMEKMVELEPELVILADNFEESVTDITGKIREASCNHRPVIIVLSKSSHIDDKLEVLRAGADDFLSEPIEPSELSVRIFAHLRRHIEESSHIVTQLPLASITHKAIKRTINFNENWSMMYIDIDHLAPYMEIYGLIATNKVLKAFTAIIKSAMNQGDFIGHLKEDSFVILTSPQKAEQIAIFLNFAFDSISPKFYNELDSKKGYIIINGDEKAGVRIPLVSTSIGIISNQYRTYNSYQEAINLALKVHKLAKLHPGSSWISDRPKIAGEDSIYSAVNAQKKILIVEKDAALAYLLTTTIEMQGYLVETTSNPDEAYQLLVNFNPDLILLGIDEKDSDKDLEICQLIKADKKYHHIKVVLSTIIHDKERALNAGADLYLPKPYDLVTLYSWITKFLNSEWA